MTVVYGPDTFTVSSDVGIAAYNPGSGTKYAYNMGSGTTLTVNAANDRVQLPTAGGEGLARCTDAAMPTGDQEITGTCYGETAGDNTGNLAARVATNGTHNGYMTYYSGGTLAIWRIDAGSPDAYTQLVGAARSYTVGANSLRFKATGTSPVALEVQTGATAVLTITDGTGTAKTSGVPGIHIFNNTANLAYVDDFKVDNLATGAAVSPQHTTFLVGQALARASRY